MIPASQFIVPAADARMWRKRAVAARRIADTLKTKDAEIAEAFALEADYRAACLARHPTPAECMKCLYGPGKC